MDSLKFYLNADELRENRLKSVCRRIEENIISSNLQGNKDLWLGEDAFSNFPMDLFEENLKEKGFIISYTSEKDRDIMGKEHGEKRFMVIEWS